MEATLSGKDTSERKFNIILSMIMKNKCFPGERMNDYHDDG